MTKADRNNLYASISGAIIFFFLLLFAGSAIAGPSSPSVWRDASGALTTTKDVGINTQTPLYPLDVRGDIFLPQQATAVDCDGTTTSGAGSCAAIADGDTLVPLTTANTDLDNNSVADTNWLCVDNIDSPTVLYQTKTTNCNVGISLAACSTVLSGGLCDATSGGTFTDTANATYTIIIDATKGEIITLNATPTAAGSGYAAGDKLNITTGGTYGVATINTIDGSGGCATVSLYAAGANYTTGTGKATSYYSAAGGTGTGCTLDITAVDASAADTFKWKKNSGSYTTGVALTGSAQTLSDGITITFATTTGHPKNTQWVISAYLPEYILLGSLPLTTATYTSYSGSLQIPDSKFSFVDADADTWFDNGDDLYLGSAPGNRYSETSSIIHGAVVVDGSVIIGGTSGAGGLFNNTAVYTSDGTVRSPGKIITGQSTLSSGSATVTLSGKAVFTGTTTYSVTASRSDTSTYTHSLKIVNGSASQFTMFSSNGTDTDTVSWIAAGY